MERNVALEYIVELIKVRQNEQDNMLITEWKGEKVEFSGSHYILGQIVRQYKLLDSQWYISKKAYAIWKQLSSDNIWDYVYRDTVVCTGSESIIDMEFFKGREKKPYKVEAINPGDKICFNDVFHDEHMTDIKSILSELYSLDEPSPETVKRVLDKIIVARILKTEDRKITKNFGRGTDLREIRKIYQDAGIELLKKTEVID